MAATASILPINEKFQKTLSLPLGSRASLNEFVFGKHAEEGSVVAASPLETIAAAFLKECGSGRKYKARVVYEDDVGMGTANRPPMVINDDNGKARTMNDVVASSSEHKYAPSAPPCEQYPIPVLTAEKGKACIEASPVDIEASPLDAFDIDNGKYSAAARYCYFGGNAGGGSSGEARTSSFKNVKDRDEASSTGIGNTAPKKMKKKDSNFDTGIGCRAGFGGCMPAFKFKFNIWVKRSKVDVCA